MFSVEKVECCVIIITALFPFLVFYINSVTGQSQVILPLTNICHTAKWHHSRLFVCSNNADSLAPGLGNIVKWFTMFHSFCNMWWCCQSPYRNLCVHNVSIETDKILRPCCVTQSCKYSEFQTGWPNFWATQHQWQL